MSHTFRNLIICSKTVSKSQRTFIKAHNVTWKNSAEAGLRTEVKMMYVEKRWNIYINIIYNNKLFSFSSLPLNFGVGECYSFVFYLLRLLYVICVSVQTVEVNRFSLVDLFVWQTSLSIVFKESVLCKGRSSKCWRHRLSISQKGAPLLLERYYF